MTTDIIEKQRAFFEAGNTLDTRSRRAIVQILANTVKDVCGDSPAAKRAISRKAPLLIIVLASVKAT